MRMRSSSACIAQSRKYVHFSTGASIWVESSGSLGRHLVEVRPLPNSRLVLVSPSTARCENPHMAGHARFWGRGVWHHPWWAVVALVGMLGGYAVIVGIVAVRDPGSRPFSVPVGLAVPPMLWFIVVRPRIVLDREDVTVVNWFRTGSFPLASVVDARPGYWGTEFDLTDGAAFTAGVLQRPNYKAWLGRASRADKVAMLVLEGGAQLRGQRPTVVLPPGRGVGDLGTGLGAALAGLIGSLLRRD